MALLGNIKGPTGLVANYSVSALKSASTAPDLVFITDSGKEGLFCYDASDTTTADDGLNVFVKNDGKRFKRKSDLAFSRLPFVNTVSQLTNFIDLAVCQFDGSTWEKKSGNVTSNGGSYAGTLIRVSSSVYWERKFDDYVNVKWFGAKGDSDINTGTGTDDSDAIQFALNSRFNLYIPKGIYKVTKTINLNTDTVSTTTPRTAPKIKGENSSLSVIFPVNVSGAVFDYRQTKTQLDNNAFGFGLSISDIGFKGSESVRAVCTAAISISGAWNPIFKNIRVRSITGHGLTFPFDIRVDDETTGGTVYKDGDRFSNGSATIEEFAVEVVNGWGFYFDTGNSAIKMSNSYASLCLGGGMYLLGSASTVKNSSFSYCGNLADPKSCGLQVGDDFITNRTGSLQNSYPQVYNCHFTNIELDSDYNRNLVATGYFHTFDKVRLIQGTTANINAPYFNAPVLAQLGMPNSSLFSSTFTNTVIRTVGLSGATNLITTVFSDLGTGACFDVRFKGLINIHDNPFNGSFNGLTFLGSTYYSFTNPNSQNITSEVIENKIVYQKLAKNKLTAIPTTGFWNSGDIVFNSNPTFNSFTGWVCITSGNPGTWKGFGLDNFVDGLNTKVGEEVLTSISTGVMNVAFGRKAGFSLNSGTGNSFIGAGAGYSNKTANYNTIIGNDSGYLNEIGSQNTLIGANSGTTLNGGVNNLLLGYNTGNQITTGNHNTLIGSNITGLTSGLSNAVIIADGEGNKRIYVDSSGNTGLGNVSPNSNAILDLTNSNNRGLILPKLTTTQINAILTPISGLTVYNTTLNLICFYNGSSWQRITSATM